MMYRFALLYMVGLTVGAHVGALEMPTVEAVPQKYAARPGDVFPVDYIVSWVGAADAYAVVPAAPEAPEWGEASLLEMRRRVSGERQATILTVGYRAHQAGKYEAPAFTIEVLALDDVSEAKVTRLESTASAQRLEAPVAAVVFRRSHVMAWLLGSGIVLAAGAAGGYVWRRKRLTDDATVGPLPHEQARALLHEARRHRLDGDFYGYYKKLHASLAVVSESEAAAAKTLQARLDDTGYRGVRPSEDVLDGDFKDVERLIAQSAQRMSKES